MWLRSALVIIIALAVSVSFSLPEEGVTNTDYGGSDSLPSDSTPLTSIAVAAGFSLLPPSFVYWRSRNENHLADDFNSPKDSTRPLFDSLAAFTHPLRF